MSRIVYHSGVDLVESFRITYRIYVLKHPDTGNVFYVGKTMKELKERLTGHLSSINNYGSNKEKNGYIQAILNEGKKPLIEEVEVINGTCYIDSVFASSREYYWMNYYKNLGVELSNYVGVKTDTTSKEYEAYLRDTKEGKGLYQYYYVGQTKHGVRVYDSERMEEDGFVFENEPQKEPVYYTIPDCTYEKVYDDENPNYICQSQEEV